MSDAAQRPIPLKIALPFTPSVSGSCEGMASLLAGAEGGRPLSVIATVDPTDPAAQTVVSVIYDWPPTWFEASEPVSQQWLDRLYLDRFVTDLVVAAGSLWYSEVHQGERPDFHATHVGRAVGVDVTQYTVQQRQAVYDALFKLRERLLAEPRERFAELSGCMVYLSFTNSAGRPGRRPHRRNDERALVALCDALAAYQVGGVPFDITDLEMADTGFNCKVHAVPMEGAFPTTVFYMRQGFELGLAFQTNHTVESIRQELNRLICRHDQPGFDHLIISGCAPNKSGYYHPSERMLLQHFLDANSAVTGPRHLQAIYLHMWDTGAVEMLHPERRTLLPGVLSPVNRILKLPQPGGNAAPSPAS